jgi:hypothetical protein
LLLAAVSRHDAGCSHTRHPPSPQSERINKKNAVLRRRPQWRVSSISVPVASHLLRNYVSALPQPGSWRRRPDGAVAPAVKLTHSGRKQPASASAHQTGPDKRSAVGSTNCLACHPRRHPQHGTSRVLSHAARIAVLGACASFTGRRRVGSSYPSCLLGCLPALPISPTAWPRRW